MNTTSARIRRFLLFVNLPIPAELQIPTMLDAEELRAFTEKLSDLDREMARLHQAVGTSQRGEVEQVAVDNALAQLATNAWRAKRRMVNPETGEIKDEMKRVYRYMDGIFNCLEDIGVEIIDETGRPFDSGMALKVISFEQITGLSQEEIMETVKPTVRRGGRRIQMGEVIVGTPGPVTS